MIDRRALLAGSAGLLSACASTSAPPFEANGEVETLLAEIAEGMLADYPENATPRGIDVGARAGLKARLTDRSAAGRERRAAAAEARLAELKLFNPERLSGDVRINYEATRYAHEITVEGARFPYGEVRMLDAEFSYANTPYLANPGTGAFAEVPDMLESRHTIATAADAQAYLSRLEAYAGQLSDEVDRVRADAARGAVLPDVLMDVMLRQLTNAREQPIERWGLVESLDRRARAAGLGERWGAEATRIARAQVAPALDRQIAAFQGLRPTAKPDFGVWKLPDGEAYYAFVLKASTTTARTPNEVHEQGLAENAALKAEMDTLLRAQGLTQGSVGERMAALGKRPDQLWPDTDAGRAELLRYLDGRVADIRTRLPRAFRNLPEAKLEIRRVPPAIEAGAPNGYASAGSIDGSQPGTYNINLRTTANWPKFSLPTLTYHEALPGHILQFTYQNRLALIRSLLSFNAYAEGWGLYAEQLGDELGAYEGDPLGRLGYLQSLQFRACRLVVDTGVHAKRWTRERALRFMVDETGRPEPAMVNEINRYGFWPGQACGYKVGHTEIVRLRTEAQKALGARYDQRAFNDAVVSVGSVPLAVLERIVDRHVAAVQRG